MDRYTIFCTELRSSAQSLKENIDDLQKKADKVRKQINKVTRGDYKSSDLSAAYAAQNALAGGISRLEQICGAMDSAAALFAEASAELSGRANLTAYYMQHTDTLSYDGLMNSYSSAITAAGGAVGGYELVKDALAQNGYSVGDLGSVSNAVQDAIQQEAEERAKEAEAAKWVLTGAVVIGGAVATVVTGGAAAPIVIGAVSGAVIAGGSTAIDQYAEHGWETDEWDVAEIGKDAFVGGVTGAVTAWIGGGITKGVTGTVSQSQLGSALLQSSNTYVRVGTGAVIGSVSEVVSGVGTRGVESFITTMVDTKGDVAESLSEAVDSAIDGKAIVQDVVFGGVGGGYEEYKRTKPGYTDWNNTANTNEEIELMKQMEADGDFEIDGYDYGPVEIDPNATGPADPSRRMATDKAGTIIGDRDSGTFEFIPDSEAAQETMKKYGQESIRYKDDFPEFDPYTKQQTEWGEVDCEVTVGYMSGDRSANFTQADEALAAKITAETGIEVSAADVKRYRTDGQKTWHEVEDRQTMQLVPREIHESARHRGGVSQAKYEMAWGDMSIDDGFSLDLPRADAPKDAVDGLIEAADEALEKFPEISAPKSGDRSK